MFTDPHPPAERLASIIDWLVSAVAKRIDRRLGPRQLPGPVILLIALRLRRLANRFAGIVARLEAGTLPPPGAFRRHSAAPSPVTSPQAPARPRKPPAWVPQGAPAHLLRRQAWVQRVAETEAAFAGSHLQDLLHDPRMAALIEAAPQQMGGVLRPLCRMLGVELPPMLRLPPRPKRERRAEPRPPPAPEPPPLRLLHPRWKRAFRAFRRHDREFGPPKFST